MRDVVLLPVLHGLLRAAVEGLFPERAGREVRQVVLGEVLLQLAAPLAAEASAPRAVLLHDLEEGEALLRQRLELAQADVAVREGVVELERVRVDILQLLDLMNVTFWLSVHLIESGRSHFCFAASVVAELSVSFDPVDADVLGDLPLPPGRAWGGEPGAGTFPLTTKFHCLLGLAKKLHFFIFSSSQFCLK